jgi:carbon monoxide dehydrogenase subunit G
MEIKGEYRIPAPRQKVWEALNDPETLKKTIPGCDELVKLSDTEMNGKVTAKVGPVSAKFAGKVTLSDIKPPESYTIMGEGQGGVAGFAKGGAKVSLAEDGNETVLTYVADAQVGGKLAQIGSRLIQSTATVMANQFFSRFAEVVTQSNAAAPAAAPSAPPSLIPTSSAASGPAPLPPEPVVEAQIAAGAAPVGAPPPRPAPTSANTAPPASRGGMSSAVWIGGLVVLVAIVLAIFALR